MVRNIVVSLLVLVASVVSFNIPAAARQVEISGCGDYFSIASVGLEGRVESESLVAGARYIQVGLANVTDERVTVPVESGGGVWQLQIGAGEPVDYDEQQSVDLTRESIGDQLLLDAGGQGTMILVFRSSSRGDLTLRHSDLGGELGREGVPVCSGPGAADTGSKPQDDDPAESDDEELEPTATERPATETPRAFEPTATPRSATATPRPTSTTRPRATDTPRPRPTATPRRATATPLTDSSSAGAIVDDLVQEDYRIGEYYLEEPFTIEGDCADLADEPCAYAANDYGFTVFIVFESASACDRFLSGDGLAVSLFGFEYAGYDYYYFPSSLSDEGDALAIGCVGRVLVSVLSGPDSITGFSDPDVNALGLMFAAIARADRLG